MANNWGQFYQALADQRARAVQAAMWGNVMNNVANAATSISGSMQKAGEARKQNDIANSLMSAQMNQDNPPRAAAVDPIAPGVADANAQFGGATSPAAATGGVDALKMRMALENARQEQQLRQAQIGDQQALANYHTQRANGGGNGLIPNPKDTAGYNDLLAGSKELASIDAQIAQLQQSGDPAAQQQIAELTYRKSYIHNWLDKRTASVASKPIATAKFDPKTGSWAVSKQITDPNDPLLNPPPKPDPAIDSQIQDNIDTIANEAKKPTGRWHLPWNRPDPNKMAALNQQNANLGSKLYKNVAPAPSPAPAISAPGGIVTVSSADEAAQLPSGTRFRTPDGRLKIVP